MDKSVLNPEIVSLLQEMLGTTSLTVSKANVLLVPPSSSVEDANHLDNRMQVHVVGQSKLMDSHMHTHIAMHYMYGNLHLHMLARPVGAVDSDAEEAVALTSLLPVGEIPEEYSEVMVFNVQLVLASHAEFSSLTETFVDRGVSMNAQHDVANSTAAASDYYRNLFASATDGLVPQVVNITGSLKPELKLNSSTPHTVQFDLGSHVSM